MDYPDKDGVTKRNKLLQVAKSQGTEATFDDSGVKEYIVYYRRLFFELYHEGKGVTYQNIYYWSLLTNINLDFDEISLLRDIGSEVNNLVAELNKK